MLNQPIYYSWLDIYKLYGIMDRKNDIVNTSKPLGGRQHPTGLSTLLQMIETKTELYNNWAIFRALIGREQRSIYTDKSTDHGNDVMVAQFVFLFLARAIFRETSTEMDEKNCDCYCKKTIDNNSLLSVRWSTIEMTSKCSKRYSETTRLRLVVPLEF